MSCELYNFSVHYVSKPSVNCLHIEEPENFTNKSNPLKEKCKLAHHDCRKCNGQILPNICFVTLANNATTMHQGKRNVHGANSIVHVCIMESVHVTKQLQTFDANVQKDGSKLKCTISKKEDKSIPNCSSNVTTIPISTMDHRNRQTLVAEVVF
ncbi:unnamed protein product [Mytilus edulis]|uniref:Uncharacterized protein n=1 Tax=Mytilus edulis TaxID=6550 RepID=A0A8S3RTZ3_MYTED|nr:unnamed protein product [Mytilus edulis]